MKKYPSRPASEIDPTGVFEQAYAENAGIVVEQLNDDNKKLIKPYNPTGALFIVALGIGIIILGILQ